MMPSFSPSLAFGLLARGLGIIHVISFASIAVQILGLVGSQGVSPFRSTLLAIRHDFPSLRLRMRLFFSIFWLIGVSDLALVLVPLGGAAFGLAAAVGFHSCLARLGCFLAMRSLDLPIGLLYPWDSLLLEASVMSLLLPDAPPLWSAGASGASLSSAPHPWVAFAFRWLLARVMLGFGKKKFMGTSLHHSCYIKHFLVAQPIPTLVGWGACRLPLPIFQAALVVMFLVECVAPVFLFMQGTARAVAALSIGVLMLGIQLGGNFGFFNLLTVVLCLGCLDTESSAFDPLPPLWPGAGEATLRLLVGLHTALSLIFFLFDSWCSTAWAAWPQLAIARKPWVANLLRLCRFVSEHRLLHAYGVFPPASNPPVRMATLVEGLSKAGTWRRYTFRSLPSSAASRPGFVAPHHPRLDHSLFYASFGTSPDNFLGTINSSRPYAFGKESFLHRLAYCLLSGATPPVRRLFRNDPFPQEGGPPLQVRVRLMSYEPTPMAVALRNGEFWKEASLDVHLLPMALGSEPDLPYNPVRDAEPSSNAQGRVPSIRGGVKHRRPRSKERQPDPASPVPAVGGAATLQPVPSPLSPGS